MLLCYERFAEEVPVGGRTTHPPQAVNSSRASIAPQANIEQTNIFEKKVYAQ